jgi:hypothetical protein
MNSGDKFLAESVNEVTSLNVDKFKDFVNE